ncbi:MAG: tetraacyldisaccharide 4'-kinase [Acidiphilium sp. 37-64-53]|uniref:tetraacyldisaccharide 4'-kinase n=1 Tax=Acidiphilium TaxID=522 RepID=UPI000BD65FC2|nr:MULTISPECIES: tetraacyldisaccharide 4'-kinase [Acidiphilium]OYW00691.1 MAG: tetraacyldisaccharide 4'-kinase [Acidiphilium sp. 37-64-53]OZB26333.1 MAG: tetraacyldisaccharide 4'-kinase [Acidiphilium sp. 34-64-41]HQT86428.1 tetraacyldisaccharide 4'-kinase [Acidiphilium rubrum]
MRPPAFWQRNGILAAALAPLSRITTRITAQRVAKPGFDCGLPVLCIGNASVGGSGKTILVRHILARYRTRRARPFALTRGHGGTMPGPVEVDPAEHSAREIGDEALLLAASAPTIVARDRAAGARLALASGATIIVMDDGLQNPTLRKTTALLVIDGGAGFGNGRTLPAGPLREPAPAAAARCAAAVLIGADTHGATRLLPPSLPILQAQLIATSPIPLAGRRVVGFAGIGRPEKFFTTLRELGADLVTTIAFPDHHAYRPIDLARLQMTAAQSGALLATTEKDAVKLPAAMRARCCVITVDLAFDDPAALDQFLP